MPVSLGSTNFGSLYLGSTKIGEAYLGSVKVYEQAPLVLPDRTFRCKFIPGTQPSGSWESVTLVDVANNIWDVVSQIWGTGFQYDTNLLEIIGGNSTGIVCLFGRDTFKGCTALTKVTALDFTGVDISSGGFGMFYGCTSLTQVQFLNTSNLRMCEQMFYGCTSLVQIPLFDTSNVIDISEMFFGCTSLVQIPLFDTSNVIRCNSTFYNCYNVESGALALYNQMSTQTNVPRDHASCFTNCGRDTVTGAAELAQIPIDWGGNMLPIY